MIFPRNIARIADPPVKGGMTPEHRARHLIEFGQWAAHDPFLALAEDWFPPGVFDFHPHRGIETVTVVLEGHLEHDDNRGHHGSLGPGDAQWMTAGRGIIHKEDPAPKEIVHSLQLWVNLPAAHKMTEPRYQDLVGASMPVRSESGVEVRVFSGTSGDVTSPTLNHVPILMLDIRLDANARFAQRLPAHHNGFVHILEGAGFAGEKRTPLKSGQLGWLTRVEDAGVDCREGDSEISLEAGDKSMRALLFAGPPLNEPVVAYGPFVMNTQEQIAEAYRDFRAGRFGEQIP